MSYNTSNLYFFNFFPVLNKWQKKLQVQIALIYYIKKQ